MVIDLKPLSNELKHHCPKPKRSPQSIAIPSPLNTPVSKNHYKPSLRPLACLGSGINTH